MTNASEFTGWVEKILEPGQYGQEFTVRDYKDDNDPNKPKFPNVLKFKVSTKIQSMLQGIVPGDKIRVKYFTFGRSDYGQKGYYCIVSLNVAKEGGITMLEQAPRQQAPSFVPEDEDETAGEQEALPF